MNNLLLFFSIDFFVIRCVDYLTAKFDGQVEVNAHTKS